MSEKYLKSVQSLLPRGPAFTRDDDANLSLLLKGLATELGRIEDRGIDLIDESDPRTASELLADWERVYGITTNPLLTDAARQNAILAKIAEQEILTEEKLLQEVFALIQNTYIADESGTFLNLNDALNSKIFGIGLPGSTPGEIEGVTLTHGEAFMCGEGTCGDPLGDASWESFVWVDIRCTCASFADGFLAAKLGQLVNNPTSNTYDPEGTLRASQGVITPTDVYHSLNTRMLAHEKYRVRMIDANGDIFYLT